MKHFYILFLLISQVGVGQESSWEDFSGEERAFLYHQTRRTEVIRDELFSLFHYTDSIPHINDTLLDYGYAERQIVKEPYLLRFATDEVSRQSIGVVMDLATRYALWELGRVLQFRNSTADTDKPLKEKYKRFEQYVVEQAPQKAIRTLTNGEYVLVKNLDQYFAPSLTVSDKLAAILNSGYTQQEQLLIINAIMVAQENYINKRAKEIYYQLGGQEDIGTNLLSAVGDGSNWGEIKGGFNTPYTIGLPDEKGLFRFEVTEFENEERKRIDLVVKSIRQYDFVTTPGERTVVHVDVFGYHPERQTTIAIQKGGNSYVLYGKNDMRLVSPDSSFGEGTTYWRLMQTLEHVYIEGIKEDLYGKRGYEYQIDQYEQKIEKTKMQIKATEIKLDKLRHTPEGKPKIKKKKIKKKDLDKSDQSGKGHPTSALSKLDKKKNIEQNRLVQLNNQLDGQKGILAKLKEDMEKAYENLTLYEAKLDYMRKNIGYIIMEYTEENNFYTFKDGSTFDFDTQDFSFAANEREESFSVFHISFGKEVMDEKTEENFARINVTSRANDAEYCIERYSKPLELEEFSKADSIQISELFNYMIHHKSSVNLELIAGGIGETRAGKIERRPDQTSLPFNSENFSDEDIIHLFAEQKAEMKIKITAYTGEMISEEFKSYEPAYEKLKVKYPTLTRADFYTAVIAKRAATQWIEVLNTLAIKWVKDANDQKMVLKELKKIKVSKVWIEDHSAEIMVPKI